MTPVLVALGVQALFLKAVLVLHPWCFPLESPHYLLLELPMDSVHICSLVLSSRMATGFAAAWAAHRWCTIWFCLCGSSQVQPRKSPASGFRGVSLEPARAGPHSSTSGGIHLSTCACGQDPTPCLRLEAAICTLLQGPLVAL